MAKKRDGRARKERKWKSKVYDEQVTAAVVAAAVDLAGILDVLMSYLVDYTSN